jgi:hypothetical protein
MRIEAIGTQERKSTIWHVSSSSYDMYPPPHMTHTQCDPGEKKQGLRCCLLAAVYLLLSLLAPVAALSYHVI